MYISVRPDFKTRNRPNGADRKSALLRPRNRLVKPHSDEGEDYILNRPFRQSANLWKTVLALGVGQCAVVYDDARGLASIVFI